jgi:hypothetical protein
MMMMMMVIMLLVVRRGDGETATMIEACGDTGWAQQG